MRLDVIDNFISPNLLEHPYKIYFSCHFKVSIGLIKLSISNAPQVIIWTFKPPLILFKIL